MRVTIRDLKDMKRNGDKIPMITAYDYTSAQLVEAASIPLILVGDSLGQVVLGYDSTLPVTMDDMVHHTKTVVRGTERAHVVGDLPFLSYHAEVPEAVRNAGRILKEGGAQSVKLEGGRAPGPNRQPYRPELAYRSWGTSDSRPQAVNQLGGVQGPGQEPKGRRRAYGRRPRSRRGRGLRHRARVRSRPACPDDHRPRKRAHHRHRSRSRMRRTGTGLPRPARTLQRLHPQARPQIRTSSARPITRATSEYARDVRNGQFPTGKESFRLKKEVLEALSEYSAKPV